MVLKKKSFFLLLILLSAINLNVFGQNPLHKNTDDWPTKIKKLKMIIRPYLSPYVSQETLDYYLGKAERKIFLPKIPQSKQVATDTSVYERDQRARAYVAVAQNPEVQYAFVKEIHLSIFNKEIETEELKKWLNVIAQGGSLEGVYRGLVLSDQYYQLENFDDAPSPKLVNFTQQYFKKYLSTEVGEEDLMAHNMYTIKKISAEKTLEVIDLLELEKEALESWFAVWSEEMDQKYFQAYKGPLRAKSKEALAHFNWAKGKSTEEIKAETLIRLHRIFNSF